MLIPAFFVYLNYFQPLGIFLFRSFYALICQIIPGQFLSGKIFFLPDVLILFLGRKPAADVPLRLVLLQNPLGLFIQRTVESGQTFRQVFVYRRFADAELPGGAAHRGSVLYNVKRQLTGALLDVPLQTATLPACF